MNDDDKSDEEYRLEAIEFWLVALLAAHLEANPDLEAAQEGFDPETLPDAESVARMVAGVRSKQPTLTADVLAPTATDEMEALLRAVKRLLQRARSLLRNDAPESDQDSPP
jgi:phytoene dehydrogenase-like protein